MDFNVLWPCSLLCCGWSEGGEHLLSALYCFSFSWDVSFFQMKRRAHRIPPGSTDRRSRAGEGGKMPQEKWSELIKTRFNLDKTFFHPYKHKSFKLLLTGFFFSKCNGECSSDGVLCVCVCVRGKMQKSQFVASLMESYISFDTN